MKSIKPGRGSSMMGGIGAVGVAVFGIFWTLMAVRIGAPGFFALFGVFFIVMAGVSAYYNFHNATGENRYSEFDITEDGEEPDPLQERLDGRAEKENKQTVEAAGGYCPYCGAVAEKDYLFCRKCGRKIAGWAEGIAKKS